MDILEKIKEEETNKIVDCGENRRFRNEEPRDSREAKVLFYAYRQDATEAVNLANQWYGD